MNELVEFLEDLKELRVLHAHGELTFSDIQSKIEKYEAEVETMELEMEGFYGS